MPVETVTDQAGHTMKLYRMVSKPWMFQPAHFNTEFIENMVDYPLRDDDILFCSYPKTGCHWVWEITRMLMKGTTNVDPGVNKEQFFMEVTKTRHGDIDEQPSPRLLNNHQYFDNQPADMLKKNTKVILVYRNPKDVAVSLFYFVGGGSGPGPNPGKGPGPDGKGPGPDGKGPSPDGKGPGPDGKGPGRTPYQGNFSAFLKRFADGLLSHGCLFEYLKDWERGIKLNKDLQVCLISYEDMQDQALQQAKKLATFLGKNYDDEFLQKVIQETHIDNMRNVKMKEENASNNKRMMSKMYRKGKVGDWKNHFSPEEAEWFDQITKVRMGPAANMFTFRDQV